MAVVQVPNGGGIFGMAVLYGDFTHQIAFTSRSMHQILHACNFHTIRAFEETPIVDGPKGLMRHIVWHALTFPIRLLLAAQNGRAKRVLSQNMLVTATKSPTHK